jgi:hypothetical protein
MDGIDAPGPQLEHERPRLFGNPTDHNLDVSRKGGQFFLIFIAVAL